MVFTPTLPSPPGPDLAFKGNSLFRGGRARGGFKGDGLGGGVGPHISLELKSGKMMGLKVKLQVTAIADFKRMLYSARIVVKVELHLFRRLEIKLIGPKLQTLCFLNGLAGLDAQQDIVGTGVLWIQIMAIITGHHRDRKRLTHFPQSMVDGLLGLNSVVLDLQIKIALTKHGLICARNLGSLIQVTCLYQTWDLAVEAAAQGD